MLWRFLAPSIVRLVCAAAVFLMIDRVPAQGQAPGPGVTALPSDSQLDALLAARDWKALAAALYSSDSSAWVMHRTQWLQARVHAGGGSLLDALYFRDLWKIGNIINTDDPDKDPRLAAGLIWLYTYEVVAIDGAKCEDRTAPAHRAQELTTNNIDGAVLAYLRAQSPATKAKFVDLAIAYEKQTAALRKEDDLLCRDGMEQKQAPAGYTPKYLPAATYVPLQAQARATMKANLLKLLG